MVLAGLSNGNIGAYLGILLALYLVPLPTAVAGDKGAGNSVALFLIFGRAEPGKMTPTSEAGGDPDSDDEACRVPVHPAKAYPSG